MKQGSLLMNIIFMKQSFPLPDAAQYENYKFYDTVSYIFERLYENSPVLQSNIH